MAKKKKKGDEEEEEKKSGSPGCGFVSGNSIPGASYLWLLIPMGLLLGISLVLKIGKRGDDT